MTPEEQPQTTETPTQPPAEENPVLKRVLQEVKKASEQGQARASSHCSYNVGIFERDAE